jgi:hypothetical protein
MPVIQLKTVELRAVSPPRRAQQSGGVFTEDEWTFLNSLPTEELLRRIGWGKSLIGLLHNPAMVNMTQKEASRRSSNLEYQIQAIMKIIEERKLIHG